MLSKGWRSVLGLVGGALLCVCGVVRGGAQATVPQASISAELQSLAGAAQTIFVGQIVAVQRSKSVVEVSFRVERPVTGLVGQTFTMREWAGLWAPGTQRYAVGQRVLAFVHGASGAGFSSPVHGAEGLVPVVVQGAEAPQLLDVRRVAASVVRAPGTRLPGEADGAIALEEALALLRPEVRGTAVAPGRVSLPLRGRRPVELPTAAQGRSVVEPSRWVGPMTAMQVLP